MLSWFFPAQPIVKISYKGTEIEKTPERSAGALHSQYYFQRWVNSVLRSANVLPLDVSIKVYWSELKREVCDADFSDLEPFKVDNILRVYVEHTAESEAVLDKYQMEEQISETFEQMLLDITQEICLSQDCRPALHSAEDKSPDFNSSAVKNLEETLRSAGATSKANVLSKEFQSFMSENLRKLNEISTLARQVAEKFPMVARGLKSSDSKYLSDAIYHQKSNIESALKVIEQARAAVACEKDKMGGNLHQYEWAGSCRSSASCIGLGGSALVPAAVGSAMSSALKEGPSVAAKSPFTSWLTSQKITMHTVTKHGNWFQGSHVKVFPVISYHFHLAAFMSGGCISLGGLGCLAGISYYRCRRVPRWHQLANAFTCMMKALDMHEEHWHSLCFPCDELLVLLAEVEKEQASKSHHAVTTWKKILKITAMLITSIDSYFVWLDLAGYVPSGFALRSRLGSLSPRGPNRYDVLHQKHALQSKAFEDDGKSSGKGLAQIKGVPQAAMIENVEEEPLANTKLAIADTQNISVDPSASENLTIADRQEVQQIA